MMLTTDIALKVDDELIADEDIAALRGKILTSGLSISQLAPTSAAGRTGRGSASSRSGTGRSTSQPNWPRCCRLSSSPAGLQRLAIRQEESLAR
jgi:catalase (peroxidase I)